MQITRMHSPENGTFALIARWQQHDKERSFFMEYTEELYPTTVDAMRELMTCVIELMAALKPDDLSFSVVVLGMQEVPLFD